MLHRDISAAFAGIVFSSCIKRPVEVMHLFSIENSNAPKVSKQISFTALDDVGSSSSLLGNRGIRNYKK